jgi:uncharacterized protein
MPFGALLPKEYSFFDFFDQHAAKCVDAAKLLVETMSNIGQAEALAKRIKDLEHEGDDITHLTVETLHRTFITPIDRDEIHQLISRLDDILDFINAVTQRVVLYEIVEAPIGAKELAEVLLKATEQVKKAVLGLRKLQYPMELLKICVEINRLENEADSVLRRGIARLFKDAPNPVEIIKWKELYELLEEATDRCEDVANLIEGVVLEHA